jgi:carboxylesterase type B
MKLVSTSSVIILAILAINSSVKCNIVKITEGDVNGTTMTSRRGNRFNAFLNIPYAEAPTGSLRFRAPVPKRPWNGTHDATKYGKMCIQYDDRTEVHFNEDCLQLNVFTKEIQPVALKPVIVFIHGGVKTVFNLHA